MRILVTDGDTRTALAVVRSLGKKGHHVLVGSSSPVCLAGRSRHAWKSFAYPDPSLNRSGFIQSLLKRVRDLDVQMLLPVTDTTVHLISANRDAFGETLRIPVPSHERFSLIEDKMKLITLAQKLGIPVPRTHMLEGPELRHTIPEDMRFPLVTKARVSQMDTGRAMVKHHVAYAEDASQLKVILDDILPEGFPVLIQERIYGRGVGYFTLFQDGQGHADFFHSRIRERPYTGGESTLREAVAFDEKLHEYSARLLKKVDWYGPAMVEFKIDDRDNMPRLMEINGRFWGSLQLAIDAGVDYPDLLLRMETGQQLPETIPYKAGTRTWWLLGDLDSFLGTFRHTQGKLDARGKKVSSLKAFFSIVNPRNWTKNTDTLELRDPGPFVYECKKYFRKMGSLVGRKLLAPLFSDPSHVRGVLHVHSDYSYDGEMSLAAVASLYRSKGVDVLFTAEHANTFDDEKMKRYVEECRRLSDSGFQVIPGLEFDSANRLHIMALGLNSYFQEKDEVALVKRIRQEGGLSILAHPPKNMPQVDDEFIRNLAGLEVWNITHDGPLAPRPHRLTLFQKWREIQPKLAPVVGNDFHHYYSYKPVELTFPDAKTDAREYLKNIEEGCYGISSSGLKYFPLTKTGWLQMGGYRLAERFMAYYRKWYKKKAAKRTVPCHEFMDCKASECAMYNQDVIHGPCWGRVGDFALEENRCNLCSFGEDGCRTCEYYLHRNPVMIPEGVRPPTRILQMIETGNPGGAEQMMMSLMNGLDAGSYKSIAVLIKQGWLYDRIREANLRVKVLPFQSRRNWLFLWKLVRYIRRQGIAVVHAHEFSMNGYGFLAAKIAGVPFVGTIHGNLPYLKKPRRRMTYNLIQKWGGKLVTVSEALKEELGGQFSISTNEMEVVYNGVRVVPDTPDPQLLAGYRNEFDLKESDRVIGVVGSLYAVKGHTYLLNALPAVIEKHPDVRLLLVGQGDLMEDLKAQAKHLGIEKQVVFTGYRDDVESLLQILDLVVQPSLYEGLSLLTLEAMSAGKPLVATLVGGNPEVVTNGESGILVPPADSKALADSINQVLSDKELAKNLGKRASQVIRQEFTLDHMVEGYQKIYDKLLGR